MKKTIAGLFVVYFFMGVLPLANAADSQQPTRKAWDGCRWSQFADVTVGIKFWYQDCKDPSAHYIFSLKGNTVEQHRPSDAVTFNGPTVIEIYEKPARKSVSQAIKARFINKLSAVERNNCYVTQEKALPNRPKVERYRIVPNAAYEKKIVAAFMKDNPEGGVPYDTICGEHGQWAEGDAYFEYHPAESRTKFIYVIVGQDEPLFDENSIVLMDNLH